MALLRVGSRVAMPGVVGAVSWLTSRTQARFAGIPTAHSVPRYWCDGGLWFYDASLHDAFGASARDQGLPNMIAHMAESVC